MFAAFDSNYGSEYILAATSNNVAKDLKLSSPGVDLVSVISSQSGDTGLMKPISPDELARPPENSSVQDVQKKFLATCIV